MNLQQGLTSKNTTSKSIVSILAKYNPMMSVVEAASIENLPIYESVKSLVSQRKEITFILPAFPAKSPNRQKTLGNLPDMGEVIALQRLQQLCMDISSIYQPGAKVVICSDGRVFNDIVRVSDENLVRYRDEIAAIIEEFELQHLQQFSLDDCFQDMDFISMRKHLTENHGPKIDDIKNLVRTTEHFKNLFNGMHRFIKEDLLAISPEQSKTAVSNAAKDVTYQIMQRSSAWDHLLQQYFSDVVRLSIHPYHPQHHKFTVQMIPGLSHWATPWHNVVLKTADDYVLVKKQEALQMGASLKFFKDRYGYFEV
jgi:L-tyrosine isonitrile synthase